MIRATLTSALLLAPLPALAHPHVFADSHAGFAFDAEGRLAGLRISWLYDAFTTLVLYDQLSLDADGDGQLDAGDLARVAEGETDWPPEYEGDTYLWVDGAPRALGRPRNGTARMVGDRVEVSFDLPLADPARLGAASLKLYDPSYYYAYSIKGLSGELPAGCEARVIPFEPGNADRRIMATLAALSQEEIPDDPEIGARFADEIRLQCD
ncbi:DUF1007 family protein [Frigidibacter sp. MR17.24]|uniref:DUF1007 family protein n=1 Tax=Frigidibacter sp. MR17.24 TaxID=3127345 RepID=UPI003012BA88